MLFSKFIYQPSFPTQKSEFVHANAKLAQSIHYAGERNTMTSNSRQKKYKYISAKLRDTNNTLWGSEKNLVFIMLYSPVKYSKKR